MSASLVATCAAGLRAKRSPEFIARFIKSDPGIRYLNIENKPTAALPQVLGDYDDAHPRFPIFVSGVPIEVILDPGSDVVRLPYVLVAKGVLKPHHQDEEGVYYGHTDLKIDEQIYAHVPYMCDENDEALCEEMNEKLATLSPEDPEHAAIHKSAIYQEGVQRLLGRTGFLNRFSFSWTPTPQGLEIQFGDQRKRTKMEQKVEVDVAPKSDAGIILAPKVLGTVALSASGSE